MDIVFYLNSGEAETGSFGEEPNRVLFTAPDPHPGARDPRTQGREC